MPSTFNAHNAIFSQRKSGIFQNPILNEPLGCMRPPPDITPITELSIICFVHALGGNAMLPHIEIHCKTMCGSMALSWLCPGPVLALSWPCPDPVLTLS